MDEPLRRSNAEESPAIDSLPEVLGDLDESLSVTVQANCDETSDSWNTIRIVFRFFSTSFNTKASTENRTSLSTKSGQPLSIPFQFQNPKLSVDGTIDSITGVAVHVAAEPVEIELNGVVVESSKKRIQFPLNSKLKPNHKHTVRQSLI